jgi:hypothetical protein
MVQEKAEREESHRRDIGSGETTILFGTRPLSSEGRLGDLDSVGDLGDESEDSAGQELRRKRESGDSGRSYKDECFAPLLLYVDNKAFISRP